MTIALNVKNLTKTYKGGVKAVDNISFQVESGDFFALLGPNGAGKSSTLGMISSLVNITSGDIEIFGYSLKKNAVKAKSLLGIMPQEINLNSFEKVEDILITQAGYYGIRKSQVLSHLNYLLESLDLTSKRQTPIRLLSGGMKRRVMVARALIHKPKLLILDEPTAGVDVQLRQSMWKMIQNLNKTEGLTVILTTHYLEEAENMCNNIALIHKGKIQNSTDMKSLLSIDLDTDYIFHLSNDISSFNSDNNLITSYKILPNRVLEITAKSSASISKIISFLDSQGIEVTDFKAKQAKLEQIFLSLS